MKSNKISILLLLFYFSIFLLTNCKPNNNLEKNINGIWKVDSVEIYSKGIKELDSNYGQYWNFNEYKDLVFFNEDSVINIYYFKLKNTIISCFESKKDTSKWKFQLHLIKINMKEKKIAFQINFDDNTSLKYFLTKTKIDNIKIIIKQKSSKLGLDSLSAN